MRPRAASADRRRGAGAAHTGLCSLYRKGSFRGCGSYGRRYGTDTHQRASDAARVPRRHSLWDRRAAAGFVRSGGGRRARCADLGTGCGVIPLLLLVSGRCGEARGFEVQAEYAALAAENARDNGLDGRFAVVQGDIRSIGRLCPAGWRTTSPPTRPICARTAADATRFCQIRRVSRAFRRYRRFCPRGCISIGYGRCVLHRLPSRPARPAADGAVRCGAGAEAPPAVAADAGRAPSLVLVESVRGAAEGMVYEKNLVLYRDPAHTQYTEELERIYHAFS